MISLRLSSEQPIPIIPGFALLYPGYLLIRQYLPKGTDLSVHSQEELNAIALQLNMRPRKRFDFKCPIEVMSEVMEKAIAMQHDAPASIQ